MSSSMANLARLAFKVSSIVSLGAFAFFITFQPEIPGFSKFPILNFPHLHESFFLAHFLLPLYMGFSPYLKVSKLVSPVSWPESVNCCFMSCHLHLNLIPFET